MIPAEIIQEFKDRWVGTDEQLEHALEEFYTDIRSSFELALNNAGLDHPAVTGPLTQQILITVDDYLGNQYF